MGDNAQVCCGAKVVGGVHARNNVQVGMQALVVNSIGDNVMDGGVPAQVLKVKSSW